MIDRIRLTANAKNQLVTLKRKTGMNHYNSICRHALCLSLANPSGMPNEELNFAGGLEIEWKVLAGDSEMVLTNLFLAIINDNDANSIKVRDCVTEHIHRGLSYMMNMSLESILSGLPED